MLRDRAIPSAPFTVKSPPQTRSPIPSRVNPILAGTVQRAVVGRVSPEAWIRESESRLGSTSRTTPYMKTANSSRRSSPSVRSYAACRPVSSGSRAMIAAAAVAISSSGSSFVISWL